jgi:nucleoside-diphosphate-sugar epimerase
MATRVAVTGAAGRVGRGVLDLFCRRGKTIVAIDSVTPPDNLASGQSGSGQSGSGQVVWVQADMKDYDAVTKAFDGCDALVHLAAVARPGILEDSFVHANNVVSSYNALRAAAEVGITRICQASSVNAIGVAWSRWPHYDYFPLDESHSCYAEDPYSLSKWICEQQADAVARRYSTLSIASFRLHLVVPGREDAVAAYKGASDDVVIKNLWGYTSLAATAGACYLALEEDLSGHEVFQIVAGDQVGGLPSMELAARNYPGVPWRREPGGNEGFFDCSKAAQLLGWRHQDW